MKVFEIKTRDFKFIVIADTEKEALIKFSKTNPSVKTHSIHETEEDVFVINE